MPQRLQNTLISLAPYALLLAIWTYFGVLHAIPYWQEDADYSWYSLSQAFTLESDLAGHPAENAGFFAHPGIPFGIVSWLAFRLSTFGIATSADRITFAIHHAENYWLWAKALALGLNFAGVYALQRLLGRNTALFWIGFASYFAMVSAVFTASLIQLANESFCLIFVTACYTVAYRFFEACGEPDTVTGGKISALSRADRLAFLAGALAALGWSIKIYYLAPAIGLAFGILVAAFRGNLSWRKVRRYYAAGAAGCLIVMAVIIFGIMGPLAFRHWLGWNLSMMTHAGIYGSGATGIASTSSMGKALWALVNGTQYRFPVIFLSILAAFAFTAANKMKSVAWQRTYLPFCAAISLGLLINLFGLLKHYSEHYALPVCATLACLLVVVAKGNDRKLLKTVGAVAAILLFALNLVQFSAVHAAWKEHAESVARDVAVIKALPLAPGQKRVWGYFSPTEGGVLPMVNQFAGSAFIDHVIHGAPSADISPLEDKAGLDWKYVMFPKASFPTRDSLRKNAPGRFDFAKTKFQFRETDDVKELSNFFVLTRMDVASVKPLP